MGAPTSPFYSFLCTLISAVFSVEDSIKYIADQSHRESEHKKATLRSVLEKQHLVKEKTQVNLLAHKTAVAAERLQKQQSLEKQQSLQAS